MLNSRTIPAWRSIDGCNQTKQKQPGGERAGRRITDEQNLFFFVNIILLKRRLPRPPDSPHTSSHPETTSRAESSDYAGACVGTSYLKEFFLYIFIHPSTVHLYLFLSVPNLSLFVDCCLYFILFIISYLPFGVKHIHLISFFICRATRYNVKHNCRRLMHCSRVSFQLIFPFVWKKSAL